MVCGLQSGCELGLLAKARMGSSILEHFARISATTPAKGTPEETKTAPPLLEWEIRRMIGSATEGAVVV